MILLIQIKQKKKNSLRGGGIPEQSLVTLSPRTGGLRLRTHTHSQVPPRRIEELRLLRAISRIFLVLPLGLLGHHLLHAERGQTDAEGGQQCGRSDRVLAGGLATGGGGRGVCELIHLRKQREKRNKFI